jgi:hypothetical protein
MDATRKADRPMCLSCIAGMHSLCEREDCSCRVLHHSKGTATLAELLYYVYKYHMADPGRQPRELAS